MKGRRAATNERLAHPLSNADGKGVRATLGHDTKIIVLLALVTVMFAQPRPARAATLMVNTTDDFNDGNCNNTHCSLREAINEANNNPGPDTIRFNIPGMAPYVIIAEPMPELTTPRTIIDGTSQPGFTSSPVIEVSPVAGRPSQPAFRVGASDITIRGLAVTGWPAGAILVEGSNVTNTQIERNYIGLRTDGTTQLGNEGIGGIGVYAGASSTHISMNVVSANNVGIAIADLCRFHCGSSAPAPEDTTAEGNFVGTDASGTVGRGNWATGIIALNVSDVTLRSNVISDNGFGTVYIGAGGVYLDGAGDVVIEGNKVGTSVDGTAALGNHDMGIIVDTPTGDVTIGGSSPNQRNVISGNVQHGIWLATASGVVIQGNYIGTDASGMAPLGNHANGIHIGSGGDNLIGGPNPGEGNVISGNSFLGITLDTGTGNNTIHGNLIGPDQSGTGLIGNGRSGILVASILGSALIGGPNPGEGNVISGNAQHGILFWNDDRVTGHQVVGNEIADNGGHGILMEDGSDNTISRNAMHGNGGLGIELDCSGPANPNTCLAEPILTNANAAIAEGTACPNCTVEFFFSDHDPSGHGEGREFITDTVAASDGSFSASLGLLLPIATCAQVTATATDGSGNTSEFSANDYLGLVSLFICGDLPLFPFAIFALLSTLFVGIAGASAIALILKRPIRSFALGGGAVGAAAGVGLVAVAIALPGVNGRVSQKPAAPVGEADGLPPCSLFLEDSPIVSEFALGEEGAELSWTPGPTLPDGQVRWVVEIVDSTGTVSMQSVEGNSVPLSDLGIDTDVQGAYGWRITGELAEPDSAAWIPFCQPDPGHFIQVGDAWPPEVASIAPPAAEEEQVEEERGEEEEAEPPAEPVVAEALDCTNDMQFVADVTIPDGTQMAPGEAFTKTWTLANTGTCDWIGYSLVFHSDEQMGGASAVPVPATSAGANVNASVDLTAPTTPGTHRSGWTMRASDGALFGDVVYVEIVVTASEEPAVTEEPQQPDEDGDGTPDSNDQCPTDPNKTQPGVCGCGVSDSDSDDDGTPDCNDQCPTDPNKTEPGECGCGVSEDECGQSIPAGAVAYYDFDGDARDQSGNNHHATIHGASFTTGRDGKSNSALRFDGIDDSVQLPDESAFDLKEFTIIIWLKLEDLSRTDDWIISKGSFWGNFSITRKGRSSEHWAGYASYAHMTKNGNWASLASSAPLPVGEFFCLAISLDNDSFKSYLNGQLTHKTQDVSPPKLNDSPVFIGAGGYDGVSEYFRGIIDEVQIYKRKLTGAEIAQQCP
jgi:CSLREA domain-containing protein